MNAPQNRVIRAADGLDGRRVAIGLGSSLGERRRHLERAVDALDRTPGLRLLRVSRLVRTPPMRGGTATGWFLNAVAVFDAELSPREILLRCRALEHASGRRRSRFWGDRTLDLDVLLDEVFVLDEGDLVVPHPALARRRFVVGPLLEIWPDAVEPHSGLPLADVQAASGARPVPVGVLARHR